MQHDESNRCFSVNIVITLVTESIQNNEGRVYGHVFKSCLLENESIKFFKCIYLRILFVLNHGLYLILLMQRVSGKTCNYIQAHRQSTEPENVEQPCANVFRR